MWCHAVIVYSLAGCRADDFLHAYVPCCVSPSVALRIGLIVVYRRNVYLQYTLFKQFVRLFVVLYCVQMHYYKTCVCMYVYTRTFICIFREIM
jgi:predicted ferric reductase